MALFCHTTRQQISSEYRVFHPSSADIPTLATGCRKLASHEYYYRMARALPTRNGNVQTELKSTVINLWVVQWSQKELAYQSWWSKAISAAPCFHGLFTLVFYNRAYVNECRRTLRESRYCICNSYMCQYVNELSAVTILLYILHDSTLHRQCRVHIPQTINKTENDIQKYLRYSQSIASASHRCCLQESSSAQRCHCACILVTLWVQWLDADWRRHTK